jgi:transcriptional regulator with XRE-family HTH domain
MESPLRRARKAKGWTLVQAAREIGTDVGNLSRLERGQQYPGRELAARVLTVFGGELSADELLGLRAGVVAAPSAASAERAA